MDFLQGVKMSNIIPAHATIAESALYVIENGELEFGNMMRSIGLNELAIVESTGTVITNEASVKDIVGKIVDWLTEKWTKVKELFNKALGIIEGKINEFKKKMNTKNLEALKKRAASLKEVDDKGVKKVYGKTYEFKNVETVLNGDDPVQKAIDAFGKEIHGIIDNYKAVEDGETAARISQDAREKLSNAQDNLYKAVATAAKVDEDDITNETKLITVLSNFIRGEEIEVDKKYIVDNIATIHASVTESGKSLKSTKNLYNKFKKSYNEDIAFIKKDRKNVGSEIYTTYAKALKTGKNMGTAVVGAILANVKAQVSINMKIIMKLALTIPVKESAPVVESSSYQTELVSLFNFD